MKNTTQCKSCNSTLKADNSILGIIGGVGGLFVGIFIIWNKTIFGNNSSSILYGLLCSLIVLVIAAIVQNRVIGFRIIEESAESKLENENVELDDLHNSFDNDRIRALKRHYVNKTNLELEEISKDNKMTPDEHKAALELLEERVNVS